MGREVLTKHKACNAPLSPFWLVNFMMDNCYGTRNKYYLFVGVIPKIKGMTIVVKVTRKGQATIPKKLRERFGITDRVVFSETEQGILIKHAPKPADDYGSLRGLFGDKTSREILAEARMEDARKEKLLLEHLQA